MFHNTLTAWQFTLMKPVTFSIACRTQNCDPVLLDDWARNDKGLMRIFYLVDYAFSLQFYVYLDLSILYYACAYLMTLSCPGGETGRRKGLK